MNKKLVVYFSASGVTKSVAIKLAEATKSDIYEIVPKEPYTSDDLDWTNKNSRSSIEMSNKECRPEIAGKIDNIEDYDTIFLGFPIWWYVAPRIINTFLEEYDFSSKTIIPFATSGSSGMGDTVEELKKSCSVTTKWNDGKRFSSSVSVEELKDWINSLNV